MDSKNKNILIGGLLAIVLIMAVGYAAFATQLNINGTATIDSTWNVHFNTTKGTAQYVVHPTTAQGGTTVTGSHSFQGVLDATLTANLHQPGDSVQFVVPIINEGSMDATLDAVTLAVDGGTGTEYSKTKGHIKWEITSQPSSSLVKTNGETDITVVASFIGTEGNVTAQESASAEIHITYTQANA